MLTIGALGRETGTKVETVRYYERIGILPAPPRSAGGQRRYAPEHLKRLNFVRRARGLGFSLDDVRGLLRLVDDGGTGCEEVRGIAGAHLGTIADKIADLRRMENVLSEMVRHCENGDMPGCPIIEALFQPAQAPAATLDGSRP